MVDDTVVVQADEVAGPGAGAVQEGTDAGTPEADKETPSDVKPPDEDSGDDAEDESGGQAHKRRSGSARLKARLAELQAENETLRRIVPRQDNAAVIGSLVEQEVGPAPKEADFKDWTDYQTARIAYDTEKRIVARELRKQAAQAEHSSKAMAEEVVEAFNERVDRARKALPDFDDVTNAAKAGTKSQEVARLILTSEKGPEIAYYLAKNPAEIRRLDSLSPSEAARAIGKLEATVSVAEPRKSTKAPEPVPPMKGTVKAAKALADMSFSEYDAYMTAREKNKRRR